MKVYIVGISCVGKTTVGMLLAEKLGYDFVDFDSFVEKRFCSFIERIKNTCFNEHASGKYCFLTTLEPLILLCFFKKSYKTTPTTVGRLNMTV